MNVQNLIYTDYDFSRLLYERSVSRATASSNVRREAAALVAIIHFPTRYGHTGSETGMLGRGEDG